MLVRTFQRLFSIAPETALGRAVAACGEHISVAFWFSALINLLYLAPSLYMLQVYDRVLTTQSAATLAFVSLALALAFIAMGFLDFARGRLLARAALRLERRLATDALHASFLGAAGSRRGDAPRALDNLRNAFAGPGIAALFDIPWTPLFLVVCFLLHWSLGLLALAGAVLVTLVARASERAQRAPLKASIEAAGLAALAHEAAAGGADVARALGMRSALLERDRALREKAATAGAGALANQAGFSSATRVLRLAVQSALLGLGGFLAIEGQISPGAIIAASIIAARALAPLDALVGSWRQLALAREGLDSLRRQLEALDAYTPGVIALPQPTARLQAEGVSVGRPDGGPGLILANVSLIVEPGEVMAVSGPSGAGKTTLARVMAGALAPSEGAMRLDGVDFGLWDDAALGRLIGYMPQQPVLYPGTLVDNISRFARFTGMGENEVMAQTVAAARLAGAHDMIMRLPRGYQTHVGSNGGGLSMGQAQRVALARAVFGEPIAFVFDEPNASLDQDGEAALLRCILALKNRGACVLVVAHRASVASVVDKIAVMRNGVVERIASKAEFMAAKAGQPPRPVVVVRNEPDSEAAAGRDPSP
jgi:PrtD family type I secretion system ABC transporter